MREAEICSMSESSFLILSVHSISMAVVKLEKKKYENIFGHRTTKFIEFRFPFSYTEQNDFLNFSHLSDFGESVLR